MISNLHCFSPSISGMRASCKEFYTKEAPLLVGAAGLTNEELNRMVTGYLTGYLMCLDNAERKGDPGPRL
ncbi:hypothetical protein ND861_06915 [Leptospira sp. 2 VSF19]|uniref:Uncharacterized protein n=1 Tax=Leptospira soteropolitanensis TaxID=2950025 RepID=A0ABT3MGQ9_9LEPT|nr:hypothetical protein [Leptospira soteropolitanensis]MCW7492381.1 hypothetical protein [Leptospira soteropolitanensis]MCW7499961.1 hypothetical protein [Leptospira soteropolitanensis]MCW7522213.1 hypothetical protein [Leptospira soteropolitanensis]MCW7526068.1 hypothetical protein [Leptospira soteropolitanensis]